MIRKILVFALLCSPVFLSAQLLKKENSTAALYKQNVLLIDSIQKIFNKEKDVKARAGIFNRFFDSPRGQELFFARYKAWMQRDMAQHYASLNDVPASNAWIGRIEDERVKAESIRLAATAYAGAGNSVQALKMLKPILDSLLRADGTIKQADINLFTNTVRIYVRNLAPGSRKQVVHYLRPLYKISGGFFPSDVSDRVKNPDMDVKDQLFYRYAKALPAEGNEKEIAEVIASAFQLGVVPLAMQKDVLTSFSDLPGFDQYVKEFNVEGKAGFEKNVSSLLAKPDLNGKVWGAAALKGKFVLLDFWGSWCLPCRFTHPHLKEVYSKYKDKGFEIVGISMEASPDLEKAKQSWKKAVAEDGISWVQLLNNENADRFDAVKSFGIGVFPTKILLDKEGREIARYTGGSGKSFEEKMAAIFGF